MYRLEQLIPYPTHKSPMDGDTPYRDHDWLLAASTDRTFALPVGAAPGITRHRKLHLLASRFWPALARWVAARQLVLPGAGPVLVLGGWSRADMLGMLDWYRECLHLVSRWDDAAAAHADGVWRVALETSPWRGWPEFAPLLCEPVLDAEGRPRRDREGRVVLRERDPCAEGMEDAFMDVWEAVANARPLGGAVYGPGDTSGRGTGMAEGAQVRTRMCGTTDGMRA